MDAASTSRCSRPTRPRWSFASSTIFGKRRSSVSSCPSSRTRCGTATCPTRGPARSTATGSTAPTTREAATASTRTSCCSTPTPRRSMGELSWNPAVFGYRWRSGDDTTFDERDSAAFVPKRARRSIRPSPGARPPAAPAVGPDLIYETHVRGFTKLHPAGAGAAARHVRGLEPARGHRLHQVARRHRRRAAAGPQLRQRRPPAEQGPHQLLGLQHDRLLRAGPRFAATPISPSPSSRRWWRTSTPPASRSSSTSSTTTRRRATSSARPSPSRASTTTPTTACRRTTRATTSTTPAPATRSTCRTRACCRW